jgi:acetylornithine deacetylase/succinyl-diaminopimelate desuccinylase-like protein
MPVLDPSVDRVLEDAKRICATPAPTFDEARRAELVSAMFAQAGAQPDTDEAGNVVCPFGTREGPATIFAAHLDTVFGLEQPIEIREDPSSGRIHAPGIGDNSLGVAALVHLARRYAERPPSARVVLAATVGEEGLGDLRGAKHLLASVPCHGFVAVEGGTVDSLETAGIGSVRYRITYRGRGGHSWSDRGVPSAAHGLIADAAVFLAQPTPEGAARNIGTLSGGTSINTIAASATLELDLRAEDEQVLAALASAGHDAFARPPAGLRAEVELIGDRPSGAIAPDHPLLAAARRARAQAGLPPAREHASSTDANVAYGMNIPAITVGLTVAANAHRAEEYIETAPLAGGLAALEALAAELGAAG